MKVLNLHIVHRLLAVSLVNEEGKRGATLSELKTLFNMIEKIELTEEEREGVGLAVDKESNRVKWDAEKDIEKEIELSNEEYSKLREIFKRKNEEKAFSFETMHPMLELAAMLDIEV
jgi:hypothetical protein